ncbi:hypothetical protein DTO207G8_194 [Paecilomyces variotii]|nr:hypothetical protein DTO169E5_3185 [Paecilomyces variotii]KAJ9261044.1 hypothetical protein DTO207G8_194 [Paecilomyces variotii]
MSPVQYDHVIQLPTTPNVDDSTVDPRAIAQQWISSLETVLSQNAISRLGDLFHEESWWRDMLALEWDFHTIHGLSRIQDFLNQNQPQARLSSFRLQDKGKYQPSLAKPVPDIHLQWVASMFFFETKIGRGTGFLRLTPNAEGKWKAYAVYTSLQELKGFDEPLGPKRVYGTLDSMPDGPSGGTWFERRQRQMEFLDEEPRVLLIGAGQSGLNLGARLQSLGLSCLIVDKNERVGDNWRKRYRTLVTHDPAEFTHMAYLPFPKNWPQFTPKDKLGDWFEAYASLMELNVWTKTTIKSAVYDDAKSEWTVTVVRDGQERTFHPYHVVCCTGHSGEPKIPTFPGQQDFQGLVYHGSQHTDASQHDVKGKKVIVVGTGNSGHDIAENFYENGAEVTMLQRSGTYVISLDKGVFMMHEGVHDEYGPPTEEADIFTESLPWPVQFALNVYGTKRISAADSDLLSGLTAAGFKLNFGIDNAGISRLYYTRGGGYYIDVGCSKLIIDRKIKVKQSPEGISGFTHNALVLKDGSELTADIVVLATGYDNMRTSVHKILGPKVAERCKDVWDLDEEGELNAMWRPSGHPNFWYMGGNLALCRVYSKFLALQIKAAEEGLSSKSKGLDSKL